MEKSRIQQRKQLLLMCAIYFTPSDQCVFIGFDKCARVSEQVFAISDLMSVSIFQEESHLRLTRTEPVPSAPIQLGMSL